MTAPNVELTPQIPPEVQRYLRGAPAESRQFDFLVGDWDISVTRYSPDGSVLLKYPARWSAKSLHDGRMMLDDFTAYSASGKELSSYVTLRTYCEATERWEISGLGALQPATNARWHGQWKDNEMQTEAIGADANGTSIRNRIRFFSIEGDRFAWESRVSFDDGKTWFLVASLTAVRVSR